MSDIIRTLMKICFFGILELMPDQPFWNKYVHIQFRNVLQLVLKFNKGTLWNKEMFTE